MQYGQRWCTRTNSPCVHGCGVLVLGGHSCFKETLTKAPAAWSNRAHEDDCAICYHPPVPEPARPARYGYDPVSRICFQITDERQFCMHARLGPCMECAAQYFAIPYPVGGRTGWPTNGLSDGNVPRAGPAASRGAGGSAAAGVPPRSMNETEFNARMRSALRAHGLQVVHVREADQPGALDLAVWEGTRMLGWIELKVDREAVRPSQIDFARGLAAGGTPAFVLRYWNETGQADFSLLDGLTVRTINPWTFDWRNELRSASRYSGV